MLAGEREFRPTLGRHATELLPCRWRCRVLAAVLLSPVHVTNEDGCGLLAKCRVWRSSVQGSGNNYDVQLGAPQENFDPYAPNIGAAGSPRGGMQ